MLNMEKEPKQTEEDRKHGNLYDPATDCHGLVIGDEDVLWLSQKKICLYKCWTCHSFYYAYRYYFPQRICPYCGYDYNEPLDSYNDIKAAIAEIEDRVSVRYGEHKTIQQIIEGDGINGNG